MTKKEELFNEKLKDIFIGEEIKGKSGHANLMRIKSNYFDEVFQQLNEDIEERLSRFDNEQEFREELYSKLYTFMKKYFSDSGSIYFTYTPLNEKTYEEVYDNKEDVALFWKTHMLYYVKTDTIWNELEIENKELDGEEYDIHFDVSEMEGKDANKKKELVFDSVDVGDQKIEFKVVYSSHGSKTDYDDLRRKLDDEGISITNEEIQEITSIFKKQNQVDFFISKEPEKFLKKRFDLWVNNYLVDEKSVFERESLEKIKAIRDTAYDLIGFVSQFERELKKIWEKPKFALESNYIITLDRVAHLGGIDLIKEIESSKGFDEQVQEWKNLGIIEESPELVVSTVEGEKLNEEYRKLPIDTKYFSDSKNKIISNVDNLHEELDGRLIHSENYQALNSFQKKLRGEIQTIYIDPPFNTGDDFHYIDDFRDSTWLTLMSNRTNLCRDLLSNEGNFFLHLDHHAAHYGRPLLDETFGEENFQNEIAWGYRTQGVSKDRFPRKHDNIYFYAKNEEEMYFNPIQKRTYYENEFFADDVDEEGNYYSDNFIRDIWDQDDETKPFISGSNEFWGLYTQKPEGLIKRILRTTSREGDLILDFFAGSGTSMAAAHKMNRDWIVVEMGDYFHEKVIPRVKEVFASEGEHEPTGISEEVDWGGGGFAKYFSLEQHEQALKKCTYEDSKPFDFQSEKIYNEYAFLNDDKMLDVVDIDREDEEVNIDLTEIYPNVDIAETLSNIKGKKIMRINENSVEFVDGEVSKFDKIKFKDVKPLIWWD
jgi:adenine specific DNA methylase Mod